MQIQFRDLPIQKKISLVIIVGMTSATIIALANFITLDRMSVKRNLSEEMRVLAQITAARSAVAVSFGDVSNASENLATLALRSTIQYACIYSDKRKLFAHYQRGENLAVNCEKEFSEPSQPYVFSEKYLHVYEPITRRGSVLGFVTVTSDLSPIVKRMQQWVYTGIFVVIAAVLVAFLFTRRMQKAIVTPIVNLAELMDRVKRENDLTLKATLIGKDEVGHLVETFNEMLAIIYNNNKDLQILYRELVEKSAEAEKTAASLEVSNKHIKDLFGSAAHDLRQPLQAISIFADTLLRQVDSESQRDVIHKLKQSLQNLGDLFNEILDVSRYDFDLSVVGTKPMPIKPLITKVSTEFEAMAQDKGLRLKFHTLDYTVVAHAALLERIIRNLLSNAIRYTDSGGILLGCRRRGEELAIEVWDTGCGIPDQKIDTIFSKFVQANDREIGHRGGYGLGLAIVKQFVDSLGYKISVISRVGHGTVFRLLVPLVEITEEQRSDTQSFKAIEEGQAPKEINKEIDQSDPGSSLPTMTGDSLIGTLKTQRSAILLDDDQEVTDALSLLLQNIGMETHAFVSFDELKTYVDSEDFDPPDIVICDYQLGDQFNGGEVIEQIRRVVNEDLAAFIISGASDDEVWKEIQDTGIPYLRKPVKPARLRAMINHVLG